MTENNQQELEKLETKIMTTLTNEASEPKDVKGYGILLIFKRPSFTEKYKGRAWANKKLQELDLVDDDAMSTMFRYWGMLNSYVVKALVEDPNGRIKSGDKIYSEYIFIPEQDLDYKSLFEKLVIAEIYNKRNLADDVFVTKCIDTFLAWIESFTITTKEGEAVKNS